MLGLKHPKITIHLLTSKAGGNVLKQEFPQI